MDVKVSIGITPWSAERKQRLLQEMRAYMKDPQLYRGHEYTRCFDFEGDSILMNKNEDETIDLTLSGDGGHQSYPIFGTR